MGTFWDCIADDKRGKAYVALAQLYYQLSGDKMPEPEGLRGEPARKPHIINATDYLEEQEIELDKEIRLPPKHQKKVG